MKKILSVMAVVLVLIVLGWGRAVAIEKISINESVLSDEMSQVQNLGNRIATRMQSGIDRMRGLQVRIRSRITKIKKTHKDVSQINILADSIDLNLDSAQESLNHFREVLASTKNVSDGYLAYEQLATPEKAVKDELATAKLAMKQMVWGMISLEGAAK